MHPLDPLSAEEITAAADILRREQQLTDRWRFASIELREPSKETVKAFTPGAAITRGSLRSAASHSLYSSIVMFGWPSIWRSQRVTAGGSSVTRAL